MPTTSPLVVTLWETYGSNMAAVAARVGEILGIPVHEQGLTSEQVAKLATGDRTRATADLARASTAEVIASAEGGGVIQGRNGAFILRDRPNTLHVKLDGIAERRAKRAAELAGIPLGEAVTRQELEDEVRVQISLQAFQWDPRDIEAYDAIVNTSFQDTEETAQFIAVMARVRGGLP